jgi:hypothetical protein
MGQLTEGPITAGNAIHSGQVAHGRKKGVGYSSFSVNLVTSLPLSKPVVHLAPPCVKKLRPAMQDGLKICRATKCYRFEPLCVSRDSTGHENRAFLAAGCRLQARLRLKCVGSLKLVQPKRSQRSRWSPYCWFANSLPYACPRIQCAPLSTPCSGEGFTYRQT